jgi:hypothetical protein
MLCLVPSIPSFPPIWTSKNIERADEVIYLLDAGMKMACPNDSLSMVDIIVPYVLSFLRGDANKGGDDDDDDGDEDDGDDEYGDGDDDDDDEDDDEDDGDDEY